MFAYNERSHLVSKEPGSEEYAYEGADSRRPGLEVSPAGEQTHSVTHRHKIKMGCISLKLIVSLSFPREKEMAKIQV